MITTTNLLTTNTTLYVSSNTSAVTLLSLCNHGATAETVTLQIVPAGDLPSTNNIFFKDVTIVAGDTFIIYEGSEKIILDNNDYINAICSSSTAVTAIVSSMEI